MQCGGSTATTKRVTLSCLSAESLSNGRKNMRHADLKLVLEDPDPIMGHGEDASSPAKKDKVILTGSCAAAPQGETIRPGCGASPVGRRPDTSGRFRRACAAQFCRSSHGRSHVTSSLFLCMAPESSASGGKAFESQFNLLLPDYQSIWLFNCPDAVNLSRPSGTPRS